MATVTFYPENHQYFDENMIEYKSITTLLGEQKPFNSIEIAEKVSKISSSRYFGMSVDRILEFWDNSAELGTVVHEAIEEYINDSIWPSDETLTPLVEQFSKLRFRGELLSETLVWDESTRLAGTVDIMEVLQDRIMLYDIKTSRAINEDKLGTYSLQLELYRRLVEKQFNKPTQVVAIIWFENFVMKRSKTKMKIVQPLHLPDVVDDILAKRKLEISQ